jgi:peptidoglycan/LPS O-acetylase OafA/YrhL
MITSFGKGKSRKAPSKKIQDWSQSTGSTPDPRELGARSRGRTHIPSLDGLRFLAALNVVIAHGYWFVVLLQQEQPVSTLANMLLRAGANVGMTLFFVLSGFVIHFNYHRTVPINRAGKFDFFIARLARLYPLFLLVFGIDFFHLLWAQGYFSGYVFSSYDLFKPLPLYLTFTQSWWWWPIGRTWAAEYYGTSITGATGVMWSLSTEAFFYVAYLFLAGPLGRLSGWRLMACGVAAATYGWIFYIGGLHYSGLLAGWAAANFPDSDPNQFLHWLLFQSPWGRISEFLLGAVAAQAFLVSCLHAGTVSERTWYGRLLTYGSLSGFIILIAVIYTRASPFGTIGTQSCASLLAILTYAVARYRSWLADILSWQLMVKCGLASYSLYLLHFFILHDFGKDFVVSTPEVPRWAILSSLITAAVAISYVSYLALERPAIRWVRRNFRALRLDILLPATLALITLFSMAASLQMRTLARAETDQPVGHISISTASFGENCNAKLHNNIGGSMRKICNGERICRFVYDINRLGEPASGCDKEFKVTYSCGPAGEEREFFIPHFDRPVLPIEFGCSDEMAPHQGR